MKTSCPKCGQGYEFATVRLQGKDRMATCGKCGQRFPVRLSGASAPATAPMTIHGRTAAPPPGGPAPHVRIALTPLHGPLKDRVFRLHAGTTVIGRNEGEVQIPDPRVSARHAQVEVAGGDVRLRDLSSTNGTFVNGERVDLRRLVHMDEVTVGATRLLYTYIEDFASAYDSFAPEAPESTGGRE